MQLKLQNMQKYAVNFFYFIRMYDRESKFQIEYANMQKSGLYSSLSETNKKVVYTLNAENGISPDG
jgi:hypothetical protein